MTSTDHPTATITPANSDRSKKWPLWIGIGGRFPSESVAAFVGMRILDAENIAKRRPIVSQTVADVRRFLEGRGTNQLIFRAVDLLTEG